MLFGVISTPPSTDPHTVHTHTHTHSRAHIHTHTHTCTHIHTHKRDINKKNDFFCDFKGAYPKQVRTDRGYTWTPENLEDMPQKPEWEKMRGEIIGHIPQVC